jgi:opacity protein-like surface antigen
MKKILTTLALGSVLALNLSASSEMHEKEDTEYYMAVKAVVATGDKISEEGATLEGDTGYGVGVDIGYKFSHHFAVELDLAYVENTVTETRENGEVEDFSASYISSSVDLVYIHHLGHDFGVFGKVGYEYELEQISTFDDKSDTGFIAAAGAEYKLSKHVALFGEYEYTFIDGPKGNNIFYAGLVYGF